MPPKSPSTPVATFLGSLPADRRREVERVRDVVRRHLPSGYEEVISKSMLVYQVPFERYSDTFNGHPLWYAALASERKYLSLHLMSVYGNPAQARRLEDRFKAAGKTLDMGKACVRFKSADDLELGAIGEVVASIAADRWVEIAEAAKRRPKRASAVTQPATGAVKPGSRKPSRAPRG